MLRLLTLQAWPAGLALVFFMRLFREDGSFGRMCMLTTCPKEKVTFTSVPCFSLKFVNHLSGQLFEKKVPGGPGIVSAPEWRDRFMMPEYPVPCVGC